jgi:serine/threonine protein kinase
MTGSTDISSGNAEQDTSRRIFDPNCEYMYDWQTTFHPTCNEFHATNLADVLVDNRAELLGNGGWRQGWKMTYPRMNTAASTNAIWKTSLFRRMYAVAMIAREKSRVDAVAMERLQGSPRVIDIYSYCAMSVATEFVGGGNNTMDEATRDMSPREKLSVAIEIAQSIAEVHSMARLAHNDLHAGNLLFTTSGKRLKVNDFNQGVLFTKHNKTGEICLSAGSSSTRILRGPEEQEQDRADRDARGDKANNGVKTDKVDIYFLGNALFRLAVGRKPWKHGNAKYKRWAAEQKRHGSLPRVPSDVHNSPDPAVQTLLKAVQACYRYDPKARPTAAQVVAFLQNQTSTL